MLIGARNFGLIGGAAERGIGFRFLNNSGIGYSGLITGGNTPTFANLVDGNLTNWVGDSSGADNNSITVVLYGISPAVRFNLLRVYINSAFPSGGVSAGRWNQVAVEGSNDTTNGTNGTWTNIGWDDGTTLKDLSVPQDQWVNYPFNNVAPYAAYRFRQTNIEQYISIHEIELIAR